MVATILNDAHAVNDPGHIVDHDVVARLLNSFHQAETLAPAAGGTVNPDLGNGKVKIVNLPAGNITLGPVTSTASAANASLYYAGMELVIVLVQDPTGGRVVTWDASYGSLMGSAAYDLSANSTTVLRFVNQAASGATPSWVLVQVTPDIVGQEIDYAETQATSTNFVSTGTTQVDCQVSISVPPTRGPFMVEFCCEVQFTTSTAAANSTVLLLFSLYETVSNVEWCRRAAYCMQTSGATSVAVVQDFVLRRRVPPQAAPTGWKIMGWLSAAAPTSWNSAQMYCSNTQGYQPAHCRAVYC